MKSIVKLIKDSQIYKGYRIKRKNSNLTDEIHIKTLINKLRPINCGKELIRFGTNGDGGYLIPNDLEGIKACFSPGVDCVSDFEMDCANKDIKVFLADKSVKSPAIEHKLFHFTNKYIGARSDDNFMTLDDWVEEYMPCTQDELLLQMDIERGEYEVLLAISDKLLKRFRIIVIEFHHLQYFWNKTYFDLISVAFDKLLQTHSCVHNHPNNCCGLVENKNIKLPIATELTFIRNDRITDSGFISTFPHILDFNNTDNEPLDLPECWYKDSD